MRIFTSAVAFLLATASLGFGASEIGDGKTKRYLYMSTPDGAQKEGRAEGAGILIFDIDDGHKLVRRIDIPIFSEGLRGFTGNLKTHSVYYSSTNRRLGAFDLETEKVVWEKTYEAGCDRSSITMDGKKIYAPTGFWYSGEDAGFLVVNGENGELIKRIHVGPQAHNSIVSLDGKRVYLGTRTTLSIFDTATDRMIRQIKDVGERGIFPYTIDSGLTRSAMYAWAIMSALMSSTSRRAKPCIAYSRGMKRFLTVPTEPVSRPTKRNCGSAIRKARSCSSSTPPRCPRRQRDTSSYRKAAMAG